MSRVGVSRCATHAVSRSAQSEGRHNRRSARGGQTRWRVDDWRGRRASTSAMESLSTVDPAARVIDGQRLRGGRVPYRGVIARGFEPVVSGQIWRGIESGASGPSPAFEQGLQGGASPVCHYSPGFGTAGKPPRQPLDPEPRAKIGRNMIKGSNAVALEPLSCLACVVAGAGFEPATSGL